MEPHQRRARHRLLAGLLAALALGMLWSAVDGSTRLPDALPGVVRTLPPGPLEAQASAPPARAVWGRPDGDRAGRGDRAAPFDHRDEDRYGWLRGDRVEKAAQARSRHERGPRHLTVTILAGLAAGVALVVFARRAHRRRVPVAGTVAGAPSRGPPPPLPV